MALSNFIPLITAQCSNPSRSLCKVSCPPRGTTAPPSLVSANVLMVHSTLTSRSLIINILNRTGPKIELWGTLMIFCYGIFLGIWLWEGRLSPLVTHNCYCTVNKQQLTLKGWLSFYSEGLQQHLQGTLSCCYQNPACLEKTAFKAVWITIICYHVSMKKGLPDPVTTDYLTSWNTLTRLFPELKLIKGQICFPSGTSILQYVKIIYVHRVMYI